MESVRAWKLITFILFNSGIDWSNDKSSDVCKLLSGLEIFLGVPVGLKDLDVTLDLFTVECVVCGNFGCKRCWVLED